MQCLYANVQESPLSEAFVKIEDDRFCAEMLAAMELVFKDGTILCDGNANERGLVCS